MVIVRIEPEGKTIEFDRLNTVLQLLNKLELRATHALIIRDGKLLTPDLKIKSGDEIIVRKVISAG